MTFFTCCGVTKVFYVVLAVNLTLKKAFSLKVKGVGSCSRTSFWPVSNV